MNNFQSKISSFSILLAINAAIFILGFVFASSLHSDKSYSTFLGAFRSDFFEKGMVWTIVTTNFVHINGLHFLSNLISYYILGKAIESFYGGKLLTIVYIFGGILGVLFAFLYFKSQGLILVTVGASAGVYGFAGILFGGTFRRNRYGIDLPIDRNSLIFALLPAILMNFLPNVSWQGHLGGFIVGFILGILFSHSISVQEERERKIINSLFALSVGILLVSYALLIINLLFNIVNL